MPLRRVLVCVVCVVLLSGAGAARAAGGADEGELASLTIASENDAYAIGPVSDRWYTAGDKVQWTYRQGPSGGPVAWLGWLPRWALNSLGPSRPSRPIRMGGELGQNLYTPDDLARHSFNPLDRPYAGWLYFGAIAERTDDALTQTLGWQIGVIGPAALGRQAQAASHHVITAVKAEGWDNQVRPRPGVLVNYLTQYRLPRVARLFTVVPHAAITVGSVRNELRTGVSLLIGLSDSIPLPPDGEGIGDTLMPVDVRPGLLGMLSTLYGYVDAEERFVASNVLLDGDTYAGKPAITLRHRVSQFTAGVAMTVPEPLFGKGVRLGFSMTDRGPEFDTTASILAPRQRYGLITLTIGY